jgi:hypothetical protein
LSWEALSSSCNSCPPTTQAKISNF